MGKSVCKDKPRSCVLTLAARVGLREYVSPFLLFKSPPNFVQCGTSHNHRTRFTCWPPKVMKVNNSITNIYHDIFYHVISLSKSTLCFHFHKCTLYVHIFSLPGNINFICSSGISLLKSYLVMKLSTFFCFCLFFYLIIFFLNSSQDSFIDFIF